MKSAGHREGDWAVTTDVERIKALAKALEPLVEWEPQTQAERKRWEKEAGVFLRQHVKGPRLRVPVALWEYFVESPFRVDDPARTIAWRKTMEVMLDYLRQGIMPDDLQLYNNGPLQENADGEESGRILDPIKRPTHSKPAWRFPWRK